MIYFLKFPLVPSLGGAEFHTLQLAREFQERGQQIKLATSDQHLFRLFEKNKLPRLRMFAGWEPTSKWALLLWPLTFLIARHKLGKLIRHAPAGSTFFCQSLIEKLALFPSLEGRGQGRVIWIEHKVPGNWLKFNPLKFWYLRRAKKVKVITLSQFAKHAFIALSVPERNIQVVPPAIKSVILNAGKRSEESQFTIGILSRLAPEKGVLEFLQTLRPHLPNHPDWHVLIAGEGSESDKIKNFIRIKNLESKIKVLGFVYDKDGFFSQISVLVYPTKVPESYGLAAAEAISRGIPVIAPRLGALPEIIIHGQNGWLITNDNEWIEYLEKLNLPRGRDKS